MLLWEIVAGYFENYMEFINTLCWKSLGRHSSVDIATRFRLDDSGSNPSGGEIFRTLPGTHPASSTMGTGAFPG
jgi:hypothetical protein